ncbi:DUF1566 domain-containing protein [Aureibaculum marinum]|uniref:DUF1566 domain-containing protein n=1 Tax=Aureibaculum marinum TaxID=2487930 RepID=A0A3N4NLM4_9FLAO|nr:DUF1566 domain-containing protein [Aureibaculum marinum]RPD94096.1 DUF1566 domain-containing protein [Aureibaculum marinum]
MKLAHIKSLKSIIFIALLYSVLLLVSCKSELPTTTNLNYPIVDTNQGFSYNNYNQIEGPKEGDAFYGQDAQYTGNIPSYTDNGNGVITDNITGLEWTQSLSEAAMPWSDASKYCDTLTTGGYTDWRLPTVKELWSIRDFSQGWPWVDTDYFYLVSDGSEQRQHHSWTSNKYLVKSEYQNRQLEGEPSFIVNDWTGHIKAMSGNRFVRAVRGNTSYGVNNFVDNGDETITDKATGLMWSKNDNGEAINWEAALAYAENATIAGYTDWRLPNIKELQSIADYSGDFPAMDTTYFNLTKLKNMKGQTDYPFYWSSTSNPYIEAYHNESGESDTAENTLKPGYTYAWILSAGYCVDREGNDLHGAGAVVFDTKSEDVSDHSGIEVFYHHVRLVRDGNVKKTPEGDPSTVKKNRVVTFPEGIVNGEGRPGQGGPPDGERGPEHGNGPDFSPGVTYLKTINITVSAEKLASIVAGPPAPSATTLVTNFAKNEIEITEAQAQKLLDTLQLR